MDRLKREGNPPVGQLASPVPQYKGAEDWEIVKGEGGASYVKDRDAFVKLEQACALLSGVATKEKLEQVRQQIEPLATEQKLELVRQLLENIEQKDFATEGKLELIEDVLGDIKAKDFATAAKQDELKGAVDLLATEATLGILAAKDYATQATLAATLAKLEDLENKLETLETILTDGSQKVQQSGSIMEHYGATIDQRPDVSKVPAGAVYMAVNTEQMWQSNGFEWVVLV